MKGTQKIHNQKVIKLIKTLTKLLFTEHPDFVAPERDTDQLKLVRKEKNFSMVLIFHLLQITFIIAPTFTQEIGRLTW